MAENKKSIITKPVLLLTLAITLSLCCLIVILQKLIFPNIVLENREEYLIEITPIDLTLENRGDPSNNNQLDPANNSTLIPGVFSIGMIITVNGTGNEGLRMRAGAGIDQTTMGLAQEGEQYKIIEGPVIKDSLVWWKISALNDSGKTGWSVQDYMLTN